MANQSVDISINPGLFAPTLYYSQGDVGRVFEITLADYTLDGTETIEIVATKPSGYGFTVAGSISGQVITITTTETMTDEYGRFPAELKITDGSTLLGTSNFFMQGEENPHPDGTLDGDAESAIPALTLLVQRVEAAASSVLDMTVTATTLAAGSDATYSYDSDTNTATFGIPRGADGSLASGVLASTYSSSSTYAVGDYVYYSGDLYRCTTAITTAEAWTSGHWTEVALADEVADVKADLSDIGDIHNDISNGLLVYVTEMEGGTLNTSTGAEVDSTPMIRTDYITLTDSNIVGYYAAQAASFNLIEYDSSKNFVKRTLYNKVGNVTFTYQSSTVYIRYTHLKSRPVKVLQSLPFMMSSEKDAVVAGLSTLRSLICNMSEECIHHDNFSRTMTGYEIGKNSEGGLTDNSYNTVSGESADDGVRVDYGLTIAKDTSRSNPFTLREIATAHGDNFMVEFNAPEPSYGVFIAYKTTDASNFESINVIGNASYYSFIQRTIAGGSFSKTIASKNVYNSTGYVVRLYFIGNIISCYVDDKFCCEFVADSVDDTICIGSYRGTAAHFDFINLFNMIAPLVYNTEYLTDNNVSTLPKSTLSANTGRYALDSSVARFSNYSEHFMLGSTDEYINSGRRTERSLVALLPGNLRTMRYEFDVYFPSSVSPDTEVERGSYADIFFQLHDRQSGVSRGAVPFDLSLNGNKIRLAQHASSEQASSTLDEIVTGYECCEVTYDKWLHFDLFIKERYEESQHPFIELKIDGEVVYQSRKANCCNDVNGSSAQYGEYKNNWDLITYSERYFDNFKVTY